MKQRPRGLTAKVISVSHLLGLFPPSWYKCLFGMSCFLAGCTFLSDTIKVPVDSKISEAKRRTLNWRISCRHEQAVVVISVTCIDDSQQLL